MTATASDLADYLDRQKIIYGSISREQAERLLFMRFGYLTAYQIVQAVLIATNRGKINRHGLMSKK